ARTSGNVILRYSEGSGYLVEVRRSFGVPALKMSVQRATSTAFFSSFAGAAAGRVTTQDDNAQHLSATRQPNAHRPKRVGRAGFRFRGNLSRKKETWAPTDLLCRAGPSSLGFASHPGGRPPMGVGEREPRGRAVCHGDV